jgi:hypothetical protein
LIFRIGPAQPAFCAAAGAVNVLSDANAMMAPDNAPVRLFSIGRSRVTGILTSSDISGGYIAVTAFSCRVSLQILPTYRLDFQGSLNYPGDYTRHGLDMADDEEADVRLAYELSATLR